VSDGGYGRPPHPKRLIPGQVFFPRSANGRRRPFVIVRVGDQVHCERLDPHRQRLCVSPARLLERSTESEGRFYSFQGYRSRRYRTWAEVADTDGMHAVLVVPEWHPARPIWLPVRMVPVEARERGCWLEATADLSAANPARLQLAPLHACEPPAQELCHRPTWKPAARHHTGMTRELGAGCGDIVLEIPPVRSRNGRPLRHVSVFVGERPDGIGSGSRLYLPDEDAVRGWLRVESGEPSPNGYWLYCEPGPHELPHPVAIDGVREARMWRWRWWPRSAEKDVNELGRYEYQPAKHRGGYVWRNRREGGS
jgi:hypothetical protein